LKKTSECSCVEDGCGALGQKEEEKEEEEEPPTRGRR
jgi:hypothetical protein